MPNPTIGYTALQVIPSLKGAKAVIDKEMAKLTGNIDPLTITADTSKMRSEVDSATSAAKGQSVVVPVSADASGLKADLDRGIGDAEGTASSGGAELGGLLVAGMAGAAALGGATLVAELGKAFEKEAGTAKLGIQLGVPPEFAAEAGKVSGEIYNDAFGSSLDDTNQAVRFTAKNIGGLGDTSRDEFKDMTKGVLVLSDAFDEDLNSVTATAGTILKTGLAKDGQEALDILTVGLSSPANKANDLLDTFTEYSTQFRQLGLTGPAALGLLNQGLEAGARDSDTIADALKEFVILGQEAKDPLSASALAFRTIGLDATDMANRIAAGGPPAQEALQMTLDKLRGIEDPALRAQYATDLFGTKAEDLQAALFALDPSQAVTRVGEVEGAMNRAADATTTNQSKVEAWQRSMQANVTDFAANTLIPALEDIGWNFEEAGRRWDETWGTNEDFSRGLEVIGGWFSTFAGWLGTTVEEIERGLENLGDLIDDIEGFLGEIPGWAGGLIESIENGPGIIARDLGIPGFDTGGVVPGPVGSPQLVMAHAGETILPTHKSMQAPMLGPGPAGMPGGPSFGDIKVYGDQSRRTAYDVIHEIRKASFAGLS